MAKKLHIPGMSVADACAGFEDRRKQLLQSTAGLNMTDEQIRDPNADIYGSRAIANLMLERHIAACNLRLRRTAEWFDHPHPNGRHHKGECDFAAMKLCRATYLFRNTGLLEVETLTAIKRFFLTTEFRSRHFSENHELLFFTSRYLMAKAFWEEIFEGYGKTGAELAREDADWLRHFIRYRARRGWAEFDSVCYFQPDWECLVSLYDYCREAPEEIAGADAEIHRLSHQMLDVLLADMAVDSLNGMYCGAHGRIYQPHALDHKNGSTYPLQYLYFGNVDPETMAGRGALVDALASDYQPPELVVDIMLNRPDAYENRERKHLHNTADVMPEHPVPGSIRKYTYYTPKYALGTVQFQDEYPEDCKGRWYAHHEQHEWDMTIGTRTDARIFTHHPGEAGPEHGYWTGDIRCCCGHFFQNRTATLSLYDIPESQPLRFIHAYVPCHAFDEVVEENGFIFVREGDVFAALKMLGGHKWTTEGEWANLEVISPGSKNGAICEVGDAADFGSFDVFKKEIAENAVVFDAGTMALTYRSKRAGELMLDTRGTRRIDGIDADLDYRLYDCPYLQSEWDSGVIRIQKGDRHMVLNFA